MWDFRSLTTHRTWEDWCGMLLGVLIVLSPWFPNPAGHEVVDAERSFVILNTFTVGILVFGLAQLEYVALQRWEEVAEILAIRVSAASWCCWPPCSCGRTGA